jgi:2-iminobutanoate/2-iminopropanoate deaminase
MKKQLHSDRVYDDPAPYSQGFVHGETISLAGQVPDDETGAIVGDDIETQTRQALSNVEKLLAAADASLSDIVSVTAYLTDMDDLSGFNETYAEILPDPKPARTTVAVSALAVDARLELQVVAVKNE